MPYHVPELVDLGLCEGFDVRLLIFLDAIPAEVVWAHIHALSLVANALRVKKTSDEIRGMNAHPYIRIIDHTRQKSSLVLQVPHTQALQTGDALVPEAADTAVATCLTLHL